MEGRIIGKNIIPDKFEIHEKDVNASSITFVVKKQNDGLDFTLLNCYAHVEFESGRIDRAKLKKEIRDNDIAFTLPITPNVSNEEGSHRIQLSFESDDLNTVYNTAIFTLEVKESIDGSLAYEIIAPSVINEIESNFNKILDDCKDVKNSADLVLEEATEIKQEIENLKSQANDIKEATNQCYSNVLILKDNVENSKILANQYAENARQSQELAEMARFQAEDIAMHMSDYAVTSVNGKFGEVNLTATDVGALPDTVEIPTELKNPHPLYIDGKEYDGSSEVEVWVNKSCNTFSEEECTIYVDENSINVCTGVLKLRILKGNMQVSKSSSAEIYFCALENFDFSSESNFHYYGDCCKDGNFMPKNGYFKFNIFTVENGNKVYVEVKEIEKVQYAYKTWANLPATIFSEKEDFTYALNVLGNVKTKTENGVTSPVFPCEGVGDDLYYYDALTDCALTVFSENENFFDINSFVDELDGISVGYNDEGDFWVQGEIIAPCETFVQFNSPLKKGSTYTLWSFPKPCSVENAPTSGLIMELSLLTALDKEVAKIGVDYKLNACQISGFSHTVEANVNITSLKVKFLENAVGTFCNSLIIGIMITGGSLPTKYMPRSTKKYCIYYDKPLLGFNNFCDELSLNDGKIYRRIHEYTVTSKSQLKPYDNKEGAQAIIRVNGNIVPYPAYNQTNIIWVEGKTVEESTNAITPYYNGFKLNPEIYGTYENFNESMFPIRFIYYKMNASVEDIKTRHAIKLFEGNTIVSVSSRVPCSKAYLKTIIK